MSPEKYFQFYWGLTSKYKLYVFVMHNVMIWHAHILWDDDHSQISRHIYYHTLCHFWKSPIVSHKYSMYALLSERGELLEPLQTPGFQKDPVLEAHVRGHMCFIYCFVIIKTTLLEETPQHLLQRLCYLLKFLSHLNFSSIIYMKILLTFFPKLQINF